MLPPRVAELVGEAGHDATTPARLGAHNLPDEVLVQLAAADERVIVTENASDFAVVTTCPVVLVRKAWWPASSLPMSLAAALHRWANTNPDPGPWAHWMSAEFR
jgi:hypothetical protein